jgi:hypothetical protein
MSGHGGMRRLVAVPVAGVVAIVVVLGAALAAPAGATSVTASIPVTCLVDTITTSGTAVVTITAPAHVHQGQKPTVRFSSTIAEFSPTPFLVTALTQNTAWDLEGGSSPSGPRTLTQGPQDYPAGSTVTAQVFARRITATGAPGATIDYVWTGFTYTFKDFPSGPLLTGTCTPNSGPVQVFQTTIG